MGELRGEFWDKIWVLNQVRLRSVIEVGDQARFQAGRKRGEGKGGKRRAQTSWRRFLSPAGFTMIKNQGETGKSHYSQVDFSQDS